MKITINDLERNTVLDQAAMTKLLGGYNKFKGAWRLTGSSTTDFPYGSNIWETGLKPGICSRERVRMMNKPRRRLHTANEEIYST